MTPKTRLDTKVFDSYIDKLSKQLKVDLPTVTRYEAASVIRIAASMAKPAKVGQIRKSVRNHYLRSTSDMGYRVMWSRGTTRVWIMDTISKSKQLVGHSLDGKNVLFTRGWRLPDDRWNAFNAIQKKRKQIIRARTKQGLASRGIEHKSWLQMLHALGGNSVRTPPKSAKLYPKFLRSVPRNGRFYRNGLAHTVGTGSRFSVVAKNTSPLAVRNGGIYKINRGMQRRRSAYRSAMNKGVFESAQGISRMYPGIVVNR